MTARFYCTSAKELGRVRSAGGEPLLSEWLHARLARNDCFYDVGANIGFYSVLAGHLVGPGGSVVAFEPALQNAARLYANVALNELTNVAVCPLAIGARDTTATLRLHSDVVGRERMRSSRMPACRPMSL